MFDRTKEILLNNLRFRFVEPLCTKYTIPGSLLVSLKSVILSSLINWINLIRFGMHSWSLRGSTSITRTFGAAGTSETGFFFNVFSRLPSRLVRLSWKSNDVISWMKKKRLKRSTSYGFRATFFFEELSVPFSQLYFNWCLQIYTLLANACTYDVKKGTLKYLAKTRISEIVTWQIAALIWKKILVCYRKIG